MKTIWLLFCAAVLSASVYPLPIVLGQTTFDFHHFWISNSLWSWTSIIVMVLTGVGAIRDIFNRRRSYFKRLTMRTLITVGVLLATYIPWDYLSVSQDLVTKILLSIVGPIFAIVMTLALSIDTDEYRQGILPPDRKVSSTKQGAEDNKNSIAKLEPIKKAAKPKSVTPKAPQFPTDRKPREPKNLRKSAKSQITKKASQIVADRAKGDAVSTIPLNLKPSKPIRVNEKGKKLPRIAEPKIKVKLPDKPIKLGGDELIPRSSQTVKPIGDRDNERVNFCSKCGTKGVPFASFCKKCGASL